jgi:SAM-dependent methyltransferase
VTDRGLEFSDFEPALTGERTLPGIAEENYWFQRHVVAYEWAARRLRGLRVLDAGCGEGYGTAILASAASSVVGVDLDRTIVRHAATTYARPRFEAADLQALPYPDGSFEAIVSLQVIEHLPSPRDFLAEIARVLAPGGLAIVATPNRLTFSPEGIRNPFHTFEFSPEELRGVLGESFTVQEVLGTFHAARIRIVELLLRKPFHERLIAQAAPQWPGWLRKLVARVRPADFAIRPSSLDRSLDLIAVARRS